MKIILPAVLQKNIDVFVRFSLSDYIFICFCFSIIAKALLLIYLLLYTYIVTVYNVHSPYVW